MTSTVLEPTPSRRCGAAPAWRTVDRSGIDSAAAVLAFQAGDTRALEVLVKCFQQMMTAVARRYLRSRHDIEDAVQDAWLAFARAAHQIETPAAIGGWLSVTTARSALAIAQRQARLVATELPDEYGPLASEPHTVDQTEVHAVRDAVERLHERDRELITLLFASDLSYAEISARTGRPVGWIGPTRQRVVLRLRRDRSIRQLTDLRAS